MNCVIHFNPCNPALYLQTTAFVLLYRISFYPTTYLVVFDDTTRKQAKRNFAISARQRPFDRLQKPKQKVYSGILCDARGSTVIKNGNLTHTDQNQKNLQMKVINSYNFVLKIRLFNTNFSIF